MWQRRVTTPTARSLWSRMGRSHRRVLLRDPSVFIPLMLLTEVRLETWALIFSPCRAQGTSTFHRQADVHELRPLPAGFSQQLQRSCYVQALLP